MIFHKKVFITVFPLTFLSCNFIYKDNGLFGHSNTRQEAAAHGSPVYLYTPDKNSFSLLDGTTLLIDTAWTETSFTYHNNERVLNSDNGFHFSIPIKKKIPDSFTFTFSLADKTNEAFTNGAGENLIQLCPQTLSNEIKVLLEQKDPDTSKGWTHTIITDTITFRRIK